MTERIEIQGFAANRIWTPVVGDESLELLRTKGFANTDGTLNESGNMLLDEAYRVLQACGNPNLASNNDTGLVIGYVQSGKTLSFTILTALARDNHFQVVIVIAGTSVNLVNQSTERLRRDLRVNERYGLEQKWALLKNPETNEDFDLIEMILNQWRNPHYPNERCRTVLITVMKNGPRLRNLTQLLSGLNLQGVPTLIIDDEGDQASLNTRARQAAREGLDIENLSENEVSMIYRRITGLRAIFPQHTFLQYTATPQANLFINIMDRLSPNFIKLLTPGLNYSGAIQFFRENPHLIEEIPLTDIPSAENPLNEPPNSLIRALQIYFIGVVAGEILHDQRNRSMIVHPSRLQEDHTIYYNWVRGICQSWGRLLISNDEEDKNFLINEFQAVYNDLQFTVGDSLPPFETLSGHNLTHAINYTPIVEVNSRRGPTPLITWQNNYSWILVGGQSMDRGFTVEGLTVTYMPRNLGVGNVDTIQQRARFFGYKREYLNYCRVFLDPVAIDAYNSIIEHEEDVRGRLEEFDVNNTNLNDFEREVVLNRMLNLTRANILFDDLDRDRFDEWFRINAPHDTENLIETNRNALFEFLNPLSARFSVDSGHAERTEEQKHLVARLSARTCLDNLLNKLRFTKDSDSAAYSSLRGILNRHLESNPDEECLLYLMSARSLTDWTRRTRKLNRNFEIQQLFQGEQPTKATSQHQIGEIYPGDRGIKDENLLCIQVHMLNIRDEFYTDVPTLAIWIPEHLSRDVIRQINIEE
ncbi:MAG: Z1 domain-containing protein [Bacteroidales bacterium]|jgi:hypothetical protein|nr:Z1 domain-containing protein [Bacteroidales bacterium]